MQYFQITVDGFHDKLPILLKKVLSIVSDLENNIDEKKFKILQNQVYIRKI